MLKDQRLSIDGFDMNYEDFTFKVDDRIIRLVSEKQKLKAHAIVEECIC